MNNIFKPFINCKLRKRYENLTFEQVSIMIQNQTFQIVWIIISWWVLLIAWLIIATKVYSHEYPKKCQCSSNNNPTQTSFIKFK
jgi:hypothetical protein